MEIDLLRLMLLFLVTIGSGFAGKGESSGEHTNSCTSNNSNNFGWKWWMTSGWWKKYYNGCDVHFSANDRITCNIPKQSYVVFTPKHHLLATSSSTVAHSWGFDDSSTILEEDWENGPSGLRDFFSGEICWVQTAYYAGGRSDAIRHAREGVKKFDGRRTYYDLMTCNCEHWVRYWMYDSTYSRQSSRSAASECQLCC